MNNVNIELDSLLGGLLPHKNTALDLSLHLFEQLSMQNADLCEVDNTAVGILVSQNAYPHGMNVCMRWFTLCHF